MSETNASCANGKCPNNACLWAYAGIFVLFSTEWISIVKPWDTIASTLGLMLVGYGIFQQIRYRIQGTCDT